MTGGVEVRSIRVAEANAPCSGAAQQFGVRVFLVAWVGGPISATTRPGG